MSDVEEEQERREGDQPPPDAAKERQDQEQQDWQTERGPPGGVECPGPGAEGGGAREVDLDDEAGQGEPGESSKQRREDAARGLTPLVRPAEPWGYLQVVLDLTRNRVPSDPTSCPEPPTRAPSSPDSVLRQNF